MTSASATRIARRFVQAMAFDRDTYKNRLGEYIGGAYLEFYKARLASKNGFVQWVEHWMTEVKRLLDTSLVHIVSYDIRGFKDRRKALAEVISWLKARDARYRLKAERVVRKDFQVAKLKVELDDKDTEAFWKRVEEAIEIGFAGEETTERKPSPSRTRRAAER